MQIDLQNLGKRYHREWIFKEMSHSFKAGSSTGIIGSNGSGKSTLLKLITAAELASTGTIIHSIEQRPIDQEIVYSNLSFAAPYMDLMEELSCYELVKFHLNFKPFQDRLSADEFIEFVYLTDSKDKYIKNFSSGMKQRLKLGLAICTKSSLLLLDEPCSNLDTDGIRMFHQLMDQFNKNRTTIIGSNEQADELYKIENTIRISDYK